MEVSQVWFCALGPHLRLHGSHLHAHEDLIFARVSRDILLSMDDDGDLASL